MGKTTGFLEFKREQQPSRPVEERLSDFNPVLLPLPVETLRKQGARCMDCGIPFCHSGCPLGNLIPDWNDLVYRDRWREAIDRLHATNNFPELTGTLCPAPCEGACVLGINDDPVMIRAIELAIVERAWNEGWIVPQPPAVHTGMRIAIVGSGPAGLAAAQQLARAGHTVTVFERDSQPGGLLRCGVPEFKMDKRLLDRRIAQMEAEGVTFCTGTHVGVDAARLRFEFDAVVLAGGACSPRDLRIPGREHGGIHFAMEYLRLQNERCCGGEIPDGQFITAHGKRVVIIGGGDTGADCLGTAHRQGALSVHQFEILPQPPVRRAPDNPWPQWPNVCRVSSAHAEGGERLYSVSTKRFFGDTSGYVCGLEAVEVETVRESGRLSFREKPGTEFNLPCELVLLAMGFEGAERSAMLEQLGVRVTNRGTVWRDERWMTNVPGVFTAGDMQRGQSLVVWAIAEGRSAARGVDAYLMGHTDLPAPLP